jgi:hypothetical protein
MLQSITISLRSVASIQVTNSSLIASPLLPSGAIWVRLDACRSDTGIGGHSNQHSRLRAYAGEGQPPSRGCVVHVQEHRVRLIVSFGA